MKNYGEYNKWSVSMAANEKFLNSLDKLFQSENIDCIVESGTYKGTGSTKSLAESVIKNKVQLKHFYTLEVDHDLFSIAKKNLAKYPFITCLWGLSVPPKEAISFINNDDAIENHEKYPDVYIDNLENPKEFYLNEIYGKLSQNEKKGFFKKIKKIWNSGYKKDNFKEDIFGEILPKVKNLCPLILLDSAGGIGYLEFISVMNYLKDSDFILILDDIHHLKHFRSLIDIKRDSKFTLQNFDIEDGWLIAKYRR